MNEPWTAREALNFELKYSAKRVFALLGIVLVIIPLVLGMIFMSILVTIDTFYSQIPLKSWLQAGGIIIVLGLLISWGMWSLRFIGSMRKYN